MDDVINGGDDSDRLLVHWPLTADSVTRACQGAGPGADAARLRAAGAAVALDIDADGLPAIGDADPGAPPCWSGCRWISRPCAVVTRRPRTSGGAPCGRCSAA